jgi:hypothetical protein
MSEAQYIIDNQIDPEISEEETPEFEDDGQGRKEFKYGDHPVNPNCDCDDCIAWFEFYGEATRD